MRLHTASQWSCRKHSTSAASSYAFSHSLDFKQPFGTTEGSIVALVKDFAYEEDNDSSQACG